MGKETGAEEVASLDRLLTRLALTDDAQLEKVLSKLLPMAISRMASPHQPTKLKVMEMLNHINKRVKDQLAIKLPLKELLALYRLPSADPTVRNFSFIYIGMAHEHASTEEQAEVVPDLLAGVSKVRSQHQDELLRMAAKGLEKYASGVRNNSQAGKYAFVEDSADCNLLVEFCLQTLLYQAVSVTQEGTVAIGALPGLSQAQVTRVAGKGVLRGEQLMLRKLGLLNFVAELELGADLLYPIFLVASVDSNEKVSKRGDELLKRKSTGVNLEDPTLIKRLFSIFLGTASNATVEANARVAPAGSGLKTRLMATFTRSVAAANEFPLTLQCVFDCISGPGSTTRLKQAGMEFSVWIFKHADDRQLKVMAPLILTGVIKLLTGSHPSEGDSASKQMRAFCYQAIGQLAQRAPHLFSGSTEMVVRLFEALKVEAVSVRSNIQEALSSLAGAFKDCKTEVAAELEELLTKHVQAEEDEARFCCILWASRWNSFNHAPSRYFCMLGAADTKLDIREMAQQGLVPPKNEKTGLQGAAYPSLKQMLDYIYQQQDRIRSPAPLGERLLLFPSKTYVVMIEFLKKCFEAERKAFQIGAQSEDASSQISAKEAFRLLLEHGMAHDGTVDLHVIASNGLLELAAIDPESIANTYQDRLPWLKQFVGHIDSTVREAVGRLLGICTAALPSSQAEDLLKDLVSSFEVESKRRYEDLQGAVCATGYVLAQCMTGAPEVSRTLLESTVGTLIAKITLDLVNDQTAGSAAEALGHASLRGPLPIPTGDLSSSSPAAVASGSTGSPCHSPMQEHITEVGESPVDTDREQAMLPGTSAVVEGEPFKQVEGGTVKKQGPSLGLAVKNLTGLLACKEVKVVQKAIIALGHICFGDSKPELLDASLSALFTLSKSKAEDVLFSVGESLSFVWGGVPISADKILKTNFVSLSASTNFLNEDTPAQGGDVDMDMGRDENGRNSARNRVVKKLFDELLFSSRTDERCAGCVWLVSIISYSGRHARVQQMLPEIQEALSHLLGDTNELTQEMASRGMSIVYELGDASTRDELVQALVNNLSGTAKKKRAVKLMEDSEVFPEGALGEKPGGGNISTYKELCGIANEMGQPDLIYKFMDLANHQASLNSKRGAAFGFARIAKQAGEALKPHLRALVPKLLRYQYDPNKRIQDAMGHIWRALVQEPKKTTDELFDDIMEDLLIQAGSRLWRSRESSCLALADVIQGRRYSEVGRYLERIWTMAFRGIDDIKETVRLGGESLCRSVSSLTLRLCDTSLTAEPDAQATMKIVLPFLLSKGIMSSVGDVRRVSITTVMKLVKGAGQAIRSQMPDLVYCMLESLSSLEDQRLNYAELHAERAGVSAEKLENLRVAVAKDSPMWDTLDLCLRHVDVPTLKALVPRLTQLVRSGVGLNTRVGVAKFISQLAQRVGADIRPHSGVLLKALFAAVKSEKSPAVRRAFASACGAVAKYGGEAQVRWLLVEAASLYTSEGADKDAQLASALVLEQVSLQANEILKDHYTLVLPLAFIARFDEEKDVSTKFQEIWEENTSGGAALELYMPEIMGILKEGLPSSLWSQKKKSAKATAYLAEKAGESLGSNVPQLLTGLLAELPGRLWEGKEAFLEAIGALSKYCPKAVSSAISASSSVGPESLATAILAACSRKKSSYRLAAYSCLKEVLRAFKDDDLLKTVAPHLIGECSRPPPTKTVTDISTETGPDEPKETVAPYEKMLSCLAAAVEGASQASVLTMGRDITAALVATLRQGYLWPVKLASLSTIKVFLAKLRAVLLVDHKDSEENYLTIKSWLGSLIPPVVDCVTEVKVLQVHTAALECLVEVLEVLNLGSGLDRTLMGFIQKKLRDAETFEKNAAAKSLIQRGLELISSIPGPMQE